MSVQVYYTEMDIDEHDPIYTGSNAHNSPVRDGIEKWNEPLVMKLPDLNKRGFKAVLSKTGIWIYEIYYRLILECEGANVKIKWQIAKPGTEPYDGKLSYA